MSQTYRTSEKVKIIILLVVLSCLLIIAFRFINERVDSPSFETVVMYDAYDAYIEQSKESDKDLDSLYESLILEPIYKVFISGTVYENLAQGYIGETIYEIGDLESKLRLIKEQNVEALVEDALKKSNGYLKGVDTTVYILPSTFPYDDLTDLLGGVAGCTLGSGKILILIDPTIEGWESMLTYTVAHEYHHSVWTAQNMNDTFSLLDYLIFEGRADSFAHMIYPEVVVPWTSSMNFELEEKSWIRIRDQLSSNESTLLYKVMFGGVEELPYWCGYKIGYRIVQDFLNHNPSIECEEWTKLASNVILEKSKYLDRYE